MSCGYRSLVFVTQAINNNHGVYFDGASVKFISKDTCLVVAKGERRGNL